jgi:ATP-dependent DNA helicase Q1
VNASLSGRDVVAVLPTGAGKSLVYQLCALVSGGITVVVCPLLALMHDQAAQLRKLNVQAFCLEASATKEEVAQIFAQVLPPASKRRTVETALLFVTPERIMKSKKLMARLQVAYDESPRGLSHFVVDEAHCISSMGHDFRHDYAQLGVLRRVFPKVPCCCLTATATDKVVTDICSSLAIRPVVLRGCMDRPNLFYEVRAKPAGSDEVVCAIAEAIKGEFCGETGIVYVLSRRDAEVVSAALRTDHGIRAGCYHGDLPAGERRQTYRKWCDADLQVICATISFGLGIDKQNCGSASSLLQPDALRVESTALTSPPVPQAASSSTRNFRPA